MVTFKESFTHHSTKFNNNMIINNSMVCKLMLTRSYTFTNSNTPIFILSTTENPFLFTFKQI